jgi:hypothetical protein
MGLRLLAVRPMMHRRLNAGLPHSAGPRQPAQRIAPACFRSGTSLPCLFSVATPGPSLQPPTNEPRQEKRG